MPQLLIPAPLRAYIAKQRTVTVPGRTVREVLDALVARHPDLKAQLFDERGALRRYVNVYVRDEDIRALQHLDTALGEHDEVQLIPAVSGGAR